MDRPDRLADESPLSGLYNRILLEVETYQPLMAAAEELSEQFDFYSNVIFPEIADAIADKLGHVVFAAGRPDELHQVRRTIL
jgi:hypothetical protein